MSAKNSTVPIYLAIDSAIWETFLKEQGSFFYLSSMLDYEREYCKESLSEDMSFALVANGTPVAVCPLFKTVLDGETSFSMAGSELPAPLVASNLSVKRRKSIQRQCFEHIHGLALKHGVQKAIFYADPVAHDWTYNELFKYGYMDASTCTSIIDLTRSKEELWAGLRKSYKALINNVSKSHTFVIVDADSPSRQLHDSYVELHRKAAGRQTRSMRTFDLQYEMLKQDKAMIVGLERDGVPIAMSYFEHHNFGAYYGSAGDDPDAKGNDPLHHAVLWKAITRYKEKGFKHFEVGRQPLTSQLFEAPSKKELAIAFFKRGMGGATVPLWRAVRYFDAEFMDKDLADRLLQLKREHLGKRVQS
ncbi:hypothetical protein OAN24_04035 [Pseudodesulfovibrio sp.]|nr:hypothetical protein [Pseudodesulfovibrio sp.]